MRTLKNFIRWTLVVTLLGIVSSIAAEKPPQQFEEQRKAEAQAKREEAKAAKIKKQEQEQLAQVKLPEDASARLKIKEIRLAGNTLIKTEQLLADMPVVFNSSNKTLAKAESEHLYDFTSLREVISKPGQTHEVSTRTIQGFTQYILSAYQQKNYGGIYVYVPAEALKGEELKDGVLQVNILEARVISVGTKYYDVNQTLVEKGRLDANAVLFWSPAKSGGVVNRKKLDDFINLLNLNPDRYITATVSKGAEPNTLAVNYGVYEANPWHYFIQVDNSGVEESQWNPKIGVINTNLLGFDDSFMAVYQFRPDSSWNDNYSLYGSYDFPLAGPGLRLNIYGGYSEFDLSSQTSDISFVGGGKFIGANLRYNVFQTNGWFFDVIGSVSEEESKVTPSLFPEFTATKVRMDLWGAAVDIHKRDDISNTSLGYKFTANAGGSSQEEFIRSRPPVPPEGPGAEKDFTIHYFTAMHSRVLDPNKVTRLSGNLRWIVTEDRLVPAKMTPFGGMYSIRGYKEYELIADGGILASAQYEFDLVRYEKTKGVSKPEADKADQSSSKKYGLKKLAPLAFIDFGRAKINDPTGDEVEHETFLSIGPGILAEIGDNFSTALYLGIAMKDTQHTDAGDGQVNVSFMLRW